MAGSPAVPRFVNASYGSVREAVRLARDGVTTHLEGNIGLSAEQASRFARGLLQDGADDVGIRVDGLWLIVEPSNELPGLDSNQQPSG